MSTDRRDRTRCGTERKATTARAEHPPGRGLIADVYEQFPYAIMVVDDGGSLITANRRGREILERAGVEEAGGSACCSLFGCRSRGPLERSCLTELAVQVAKRLPEVRLD